MRDKYVAWDPSFEAYMEGASVGSSDRDAAFESTLRPGRRLEVALFLALAASRSLEQTSAPTGSSP